MSEMIYGIHAVQALLERAPERFQDVFILKGREDKRLLPLIHALEARCPKARYRITRPAKALALAKRLLPTRWLDRLLLAAGKLDGPQTPPLKS